MCLRLVHIYAWIFGLILPLSPVIACAATDEWMYEWPNWRGPQQNRISAETGLVDDWNPKGGKGSNLLWKNASLAGRSTPVVLGDKLYTIVRAEPGTATEGEKVVCASVITGDPLWEHRFNVYLSDVPDTRVGWSSPVIDAETGRVYVLGVCGYFCCLEGNTGDVVWSRSLHEEYGLLSTYGGRTNVPVVYNDTVIISAVVIGWGDTPKWGLLAKPAHRFMAFAKATGELRWLKGTRLIPYDTTYSTPTIALRPTSGVDAMIFGSGDGQVWALQPGTGIPIWKYPFSRRGLNVSPFVGPSGLVYSGHSEENLEGNAMGSIVALRSSVMQDTSASSQSDHPIATEAWRRYEIMAGKSSPVEYQGRAYFIDDRAKLFVIDIETGETIQRKALGTVMRSTPLFADGKIYTCTNNGRWYILEPTEKGVKVIHKLRLSGEASDGSPVVSRGRIFVPTSEYLYCIGKEGHVPTHDAATIEAASAGRPDVSGEGADGSPAHLQVVPYDTLLKPGNSQRYEVRVFSAAGDLLRTASPAELTFSVDGPGTIDGEGNYQAPSDVRHECALVKCRLGSFEGTARVRIVPPLPWSFDFDDAGDVPLTWVGGRVRFVLRDDDGGKVMVKRSELPTRPGAPTTKLGTRSRMWMGPIDLANYTMQADVMLPTGKEDSKTDDDYQPEFPVEDSSRIVKQGDLGLINSRYTFALYGASQEVRLYSWCTHVKRTQASKPYDIDPETYYTLKVRVTPREGEALVQGKVWPRGEQEPDAWTVEMVDPAPNMHGSPGLFGNAKDAEIYVDNVSVTPNR